MALLGTAAMAVWTSLGAAQSDWHSREHIPERMGVPGFLRGRRAVSAEPDAGADAAFVLYEVRDRAVFASAPYVHLLDHPSPWTTQVMASLPQVSRTLCDVALSCGAGVAASLLTLEIAPDPARPDDLLQWLRRELPALCTLPGITAAHYLAGDYGERGRTTQEERIRPRVDVGVRAALVVEGYDAPVLRSACEARLAGDLLQAAGARQAGRARYWTLAHCMTPADI